jgi:hypothetical protein
MASKSYFVVNIMEYLCDAPMEEILSDLCALYECPLNKDVESFLKKSAVDFAKKHHEYSGENKPAFRNGGNRQTGIQETALAA